MSSSGDSAENNNGRSIEEKFEGIVKVELPNVSQFYTSSSAKESDVVKIADFKWNLSISKLKDNSVDYLVVKAFCNTTSVSNLWSCDASIVFKLLSTRVGIHGTTCHTKCASKTFNRDSKQYEDEKFIAWNVLTSTDLGYLKNDQLTIEAQITLKNIVGVYNVLPVDFLNEEAGITDVILIVDGNQLHLNKAFLAMYSPVFKAMFFSAFSESSKKEVVLKDVKFEQFVEMLKVIYPMRKAVDATNVDFLLQLADQYDVRFVMKECESFLISSDGITVSKKLLYAEKYFLSNLQEHCLNELTSASQVKAIKNTEEYSAMSDITKSALLEKVLTFV